VRFLPHLVVLLAFVAACGSSDDDIHQELLAEAHQADCQMACTNLGDCGQVNDVQCTTDCVLEVEYGALDDCTDCISDNWANESCDPCLAACGVLME
jgi:hypothetical protein